MSPAAKLNTLLASTTVSIMFFLIIYAAPYLQQLSNSYKIGLTIISLFSSAGLYRMFSIALRWLLERWSWLNSLVLGTHYMHGTWIGYFIGHKNDRRYMVEHFIQDLDGLVITGQSYTDSMKKHGLWESDSTSIDAKKGRLTFTYKFDVLTNKNSLIGIHTSLFERKSAYHAPTAISGFAHDLNDDTRIAVQSIKLSDKLIPWEEAARKAKEKFSAHLIN